MKRYANRERGEVEEYRVGNLVLLSTKDLKYQMVGRQMEKFTEHFVGPYKVKAIISSNAIELELLRTIKIHPVVNVGRVQKYKLQVEGQKKEIPQPVVIEEEEEWKGRYEEEISTWYGGRGVQRKKTHGKVGRI